MEDRWLSVEVIAQNPGISKDTFYTWINKNKMPARKTGRLWKFKKEQVDAWVDSDGAASAQVNK